MKSIIYESIAIIALSILFPMCGFSQHHPGGGFPGGGFQGGGYGSGGTEVITGTPGLLAEAAGGLKMYPNPFQGLMNLEFATDPGGSTDLSVYDINNRKVRSLYVTDRGTGGIEFLIWDGCNDQGNRLADGIYTIKLIKGKTICCKKAILCQ